MRAPLSTGRRGRTRHRAVVAPDSVDCPSRSGRSSCTTVTPAYVTWETFTRIQAILDDNYAAYAHNQRRGVPRQGAALLQFSGLVVAGAVGTRWWCSIRAGINISVTISGRRHSPRCVNGSLPYPVDQQVVAAFFDALAPAGIDLYIREALAQRQQQQAELDQAQRDDSLQRLEYAADQARRRYEQVDPAYRLVAAELEQRGEAALQAWQAAQEHYGARLAVEHPTQTGHGRFPLPCARPFSTLGHSLPRSGIEAPLSRAQRKALLRCLREGGAGPPGARYSHHSHCVAWWRRQCAGGAVHTGAGTLRDLTDFARMEAQVLRLETQGRSDAEIAERLTLQGFRSPQRPCVLASTVQTIRLRHGRLHRYRGPRPRRVPGAC